MFSFLKIKNSPRGDTISPQVGCFGKLPIYDEFIRYMINARSVLDLDEWIQQGYSHFRRSVCAGQDKSELKESIYHFVFTGVGDNEAPVIGTMMGSRDKCGRSYPFVIYKLIKNASAGELASTLPCAYRKFFNNSMNLCRTDWSLQALNVLRRRVETLGRGCLEFSKSDLIETEIRALQEITKQKFWNDIQQQSSVKCAASLVDTMKDLLDTVVRKSPLRTSWGIAISLPSNQDYHTHVAFWVRSAESMLAIRGWKPHFIWGDVNNDRDRKLYLFFRPITPLFFSYLMGRRVENGVLISLDEESILHNEVSAIAKKITSIDDSEHMVEASNQWAIWGCD